ncbi:MAG: YnfA family protein [Bacteroidales bacterium]|nr:YnfA family protein [Bacteroidales bacterium]
MYSKSISVFILADLCKIGRGYMVWFWLRNDKPRWFGVVCGVVLAIYGIVATLQPANFGRVYAAYGGTFIFLTIFLGWKIDDIVPDKFAIIIGLVALAGMAIILYAPRN